jgi:hypothetical protein
VTLSDHVRLFCTVLLVTGGGMYFMHADRPLNAIFMVLVGIFLMFVQILVTIRTKT